MIISSSHASRRLRPPVLIRTWALACLVGCSSAREEDPRVVKPGALVPAVGRITRNGKPLVGAVVMFLPEAGMPGVGETDETGRYTMKTIRYRGVTPGDHRVSISYLVSADGEPQGLDARGAAMLPEGMRTAKEKLPRAYADPGLSKLRARVGPEGGTFDFDVKDPAEAGGSGADVADGRTAAP